MSPIAKIIVALAFLVFVMSLAFYVATSNSSEDYQRLRRDVAELRQGNDALASTNREIQANIVALREDSRVIERRIRDDLGMVRRDEVLILLNQPEPHQRGEGMPTSRAQ